MSIKIENIKIEVIKIERSDAFIAIIKLIEKHGTKNAIDLLPKSEKKKLTFTINNTNAAFANAIRRILIDQIITSCLNVDEQDVKTDDEFVAGMINVIIGNISLIPIYQNIEIDKAEYNISLSVFNNTNEHMSVKASDIISLKKKKHNKGEYIKGEYTDNSERHSSLELFPDKNITLFNLRPGKYIKINNMYLEKGNAYNHAGKFTLLNNVTYKPLDIEPYNQFTESGTKSVEKNCTSFEISFTTAGNIELDIVINAVCDILLNDLRDIYNKLKLYIEANTPKYYKGDNCEIMINNNIYTINLAGHYLTELNIISMYCYQLDINTPFVTSTVERYDSNVGIIKLKHSDFGILLKAIEAAEKDIDIVRNKLG